MFTAALFGAGCQNARRLGCEIADFYVDVQQNVFGIDYPGGVPESSRQRFYRTDVVADNHVCVD